MQFSEKQVAFERAFIIVIMALLMFYRKDSGSEQEKMRELLVEAGEQAKVAAKEVRDCKSKLAAAKEERDQFNTEYQQLLKDKTKLEFQIKDLMEEVSGDNKSRVRVLLHFPRKKKKKNNPFI